MFNNFYSWFKLFPKRVVCGIVLPTWLSIVGGMNIHLSASFGSTRFYYRYQGFDLDQKKIQIAGLKLWLQSLQQLIHVGSIYFGVACEWYMGVASGRDVYRSCFERRTSSWDPGLMAATARQRQDMSYGLLRRPCPWCPGTKLSKMNIWSISF